MDHPLAVDEMKIVHQVAVAVHGLRPNSRTSRCQSDSCSSGTIFCSDFTKAVLIHERNCSANPMRQYLRAILRKPGNNSISMASLRSGDVPVYPSRRKASKALGPASTLPLTRRVKCTPRNGKRGSGTG